MTRRRLTTLVATCCCASTWAASAVVPAAGAAISIGPKQIVVAVPGARATIDRSPFRISTDDGAGRAALAEAPNGRATPALIAPQAYPAALGGRPTSDGQPYAPLQFLVGVATTQQWPQAFFQGDQFAGTFAGTVYSARDVLAVQPAGDGVELTLSTSDPTGRKLLVDVAPGPGATIRVTAAPSPAAGVAMVGDSFATAPGEAFHGFGGRHNAIDQRGQDFYSWIEQENTVPPAGGGAGGDAASRQTNYMFPDGPGAAYHAQSLFYSSRPYGFMLDQPDFARWRMASDRPDAWQVDVYGSRLNYLVAPGGAAQAIRTITAITGRERVPPAWSTGAGLDRAVRSTNQQTPAVYEAEVRDDIAHIDADHLKVSAYRMEGWALLPKATLRALIGEFRARGIHVLLYFRAFVAKPTGGTEEEGAYDYAIAHGLVAKRSDGSPAEFTSPFDSGQAALIDFSNPAAVTWWQGRLRAALDLGADGFMQDFGEETEASWRFADGETGATMHNRYPVLYDRATRELIDAYEKQHPGRHIFFFTRAGYSGSPGSTAYDGANFLGDSTTTYDHASGLASVLPDMLNRGVGGAFGSTTDIGGYEDLTTGKTTPELFTRWAELTALTPFFRVHNSGNAGTQMPWNLGDATLAAYRRLAALHERSRPLTARLWARAARTGLPVMRPLWLAFPGDAVAAKQDEEFMLGPDVLVAPVVDQGVSARTVYFPAGCWQSPESRQRFTGGVSARVAAPLGTLPYFLHCGRDPFRTVVVAPGCKQKKRSARCTSRKRTRVR
jgi:alpha-glucosidase